MIYFIKTPSGHVKIGSTTDLKSRWYNLVGTFGKPLEFLVAIPGGRNEEVAIHRQFQSIRIGKSELFSHDDSLKDYIANLPDPAMRSTEEVEARWKEFESAPGRFVTLKQAGRWLGIHEKTLKGIAFAMRIRLCDIRSSIVMTRQDFKRIEKSAENMPDYMRG